MASDALRYLYLEPQELERFTMGMEIPEDLEGPDQMAGLVATACDLIDAYTGNSFSYQHIKGEKHIWDGSGSLKTYLYLPIRVITDFEVSVSVHGGKSDGWRAESLPTIPPLVEPDDPTELPEELGDIDIDRVMNAIEPTMLPFSISGLLLSYAGYGLSQARIKVSYTAGFDDGSVQADGYTLSPPQWLRTATRMTALWLLERSIVNDDGMAGLNSKRVGGVSRTRKIENAPLPPDIASLLQTDGSVWASGG